MLWRTINGQDVFTGIFIQYDNVASEWTLLGRPNAYKLVDKDNINGEAILLTPEQFLSEMEQYD